MTRCCARAAAATTTCSRRRALLASPTASRRTRRSAATASSRPSAPTRSLRRYDCDCDQLCEHEWILIARFEQTPDVSTRTYKDVMEEAHLAREEHAVKLAIRKKMERQEEEAAEKQAEQQAEQQQQQQAAPRKRRRWDATPDVVAAAAGSATPVMTASSSSSGNGVAQDEWQPPGASNLLNENWDSTPASSSSGAAPKKRRSRWDETPVANGVRDTPLLAHLPACSLSLTDSLTDESIYDRIKLLSCRKMASVLARAGTRRQPTCRVERLRCSAARRRSATLGRRLRSCP